MIDYYQQGNKTQKPTTKVAKNINTNLVLYLGELPPDVDQYELHQFIQEQGKFNIESLIVKPTKENKSYAYVKFKTKIEVEKAKKALNLKPFKNYLIKAELFKGKESLQDSETSSQTHTNLFVKNLPTNTSPKALYELFNQYGDIVSIKLKQDFKGECIGYGYVNFLKSEDADLALNNLNNSEFSGKKLYVSVFHPKKERNEEESKFPLLVIKKLPETIKGEETLREIFSRFGQIVYCGILESPSNEEEKYKSGYVLFPTKEEADDAVQTLNETTYGDSSTPLIITFAPVNKETMEKLWKARRESYKSKYDGYNLVVKNLPKELTEKNLFEICRQFGDVANARIATEGKMKVSTDQQGNVLDKEFVYESKGYGFVRFKNSEDAKKAKDALNSNSVKFQNFTLTLSVEYYDYSKAERNKMFEREKFPHDESNSPSKRKFNPKGKFRGNNRNFNQLRSNEMPENAQIINDRTLIPPRTNMNNKPNPNMTNFNNMQMQNQMAQQQQLFKQQQMNNQVNKGLPVNYANNQNTYNSHVNAQMSQINSQISQINLFGNPTPQPIKNAEDVEFIEEVKKILRIPNSDERTEHLGETIFYYLLRFISKYSLNISKGRFDDPTLCSKLTGMFLSIEENDLLEIFSKQDILTMTVMDVLNVILFI